MARDPARHVSGQSALDPAGVTVPKITTLGLSEPGPITQSAIDQVHNLPENQLTIAGESENLRQGDVTVSVQKTWRNGWGLGWWGKATVGAGKPTGATGFEVKKKL